MTEKVIFSPNLNDDQHFHRYRVDRFNAEGWETYGFYRTRWWAKRTATYRASLGVMDYRVVDTRPDTDWTRTVASATLPKGKDMTDKIIGHMIHTELGYRVGVTRYFGIDGDNDHKTFVAGNGVTTTYFRSPAWTYEPVELTLAEQIEALPVGTRFITHLRNGGQYVWFRVEGGYSDTPPPGRYTRPFDPANGYAKIEVLP